MENDTEDHLRPLSGVSARQLWAPAQGLREQLCPAGGVVLH